MISYFKFKFENTIYNSIYHYNLSCDFFLKIFQFRSLEKDKEKSIYNILLLIYVDQILISKYLFFIYTN